jgi:hypothetical protein
MMWSCGADIAEKIVADAAIFERSTFSITAMVPAVSPINDVIAALPAKIEPPSQWKKLDEIWIFCEVDPKLTSQFFSVIRPFTPPNWSITVESEVNLNVHCSNPTSRVSSVLNPICRDVPDTNVSPYAYPHPFRNNPEVPLGVVEVIVAPVARVVGGSAESFTHSHLCGAAGVPA